jgi:hypothetical protein
MVNLAQNHNASADHHAYEKVFDNDVRRNDFFN